ncbi:MAG: ABC transporter permease [Chloroflexota bacterium]
MPQLLSFSSIALKNVRRKPLRTGILVMSVVLLACVCVFALSFIFRVDGSIRKMSERLGADILIVPAGSRGAAEEVLLENKVKSFYMDKSMVARLQQFEGIDRLTYQTYLVTLSSLCCSVPEAVVVAFNQDTDFILTPWLPKKLGRKLGKGEAIAGKESAFNVRLGLMDVSTVMFGNLFTIVGILDKTGTGLDNAIFIGDENIDDILKKGSTDIRPDQISIVFAKVKKGYDPRKVAGAIEDSIVELDTMTRKDIGKSLIAAFSDMSRIFTLTVIVASLLCAFLAWAVFSAVVNERAAEIGIMRAMGARESQVSRIFFTEAFVIGVTGSALGVLLGSLLFQILLGSFNMVKNLSADLGVLERLYVSALAFTLGAGICVVGAFASLRRIKKIEPLAILKGQ